MIEFINDKEQQHAESLAKTLKMELNPKQGASDSNPFLSFSFYTWFLHSQVPSM